MMKGAGLLLLLLGGRLHNRAGEIEIASFQTITISEQSKFSLDIHIR
jgi:hypothetical protein